MQRTLRRVIGSVQLEFQRRRAEKRFPFLREDGERMRPIETAMRPCHASYVSDVSAPGMAVSLPTALLLRRLCEDLRPRRVLDLGSGFSSFVLRSYAASQRDVTAWSVDDDDAWLQRTRDFLLGHGLATEHLVDWEEFQSADPGPFDLVFHDLGGMELRMQAFDRALELGARGVVLLDDMHKPHYSKYVAERLQTQPCCRLDLEFCTRDELGRFCVLLTDFGDPAD